MNRCSKITMRHIICIFLSFLLFNSCDQKSIVFLPNPEDGLDFTNKSFAMNLSNSSVTMTPGYIDQGLDPLLYVGYIPELNGMSYALFQIDSQILKGYGLCEQNEGGNVEDNSEEDHEITERGDIKFRLIFEDGYEDYSGLNSYY